MNDAGPVIFAGPDGRIPNQSGIGADFEPVGHLSVLREQSGYLPKSCTLCENLRSIGSVNSGDVSGRREGLSVQRSGCG